MVSHRFELFQNRYINIYYHCYYYYYKKLEDTNKIEEKKWKWRERNIEFYEDIHELDQRGGGG